MNKECDLHALADRGSLMCHSAKYAAASIDRPVSSAVHTLITCRLPTLGTGQLQQRGSFYTE